MDVILIESSVWKALHEKMEKILARINELEMQKMKNEWLTTEQVMGILKISKRTMQRYRDNGLISFAQVGSRVFYRSEDVETFLENHYNKAFRK